MTVQDSGGLPEYICEIARAIHRGGKTVSQSIAIAVSRAKKWAAGDGVDKDTQAKAAEAVAAWEALKTKSKAKTGAKKATKAAMTAGHGPVLCLSDYNTDDVRAAFNARLNQLRADWRKANPNGNYDDGPPYLYVKEVWNTFLIVQSDYGSDADTYKVPYTVDDNAEVTFGTAVEVKTQYIEVTDNDLGHDVGDVLDDKTLTQIVGMTHTRRISRHVQGRHPVSGLARILALTDTTEQQPAPEPPPAALESLPVAGTPVVALEYADPGHQDDGKPRYQLRTPAQIKAAWAMVNQALNGAKYQPWQLAHIKANIQAAAHRQDVDLLTLSATLDAYPAVGRLLTHGADRSD